MLDIHITPRDGLSDSRARLRGIPFTGLGVRRHANGKLLECGQYKDGLLHGDGVRYHANCDVYCCAFVEGKIEGHGAYTHADGTVRKGIFKDGKLSGRGELHHADGTVDIGLFGDNHRAERHYTSDEVDIALFIDDLPYGDGVRQQTLLYPPSIEGPECPFAGRTPCHPWRNHEHLTFATGPRPPLEQADRRQAR